jgi:Rps23 Pro-64 3,4-dihydroxylase Tpa1-like proline 4-hydroxylase
MEFIYECENFIPYDFCKHVIDKFEKNKHQHRPGLTLGGKSDMKKSTDLRMDILNWDNEMNKFKDYTFSAIRKYVQYLNDKIDVDYRPLFENFNITFPQIQKTQKGEYFKWHNDGNLDPNRRIASIIYYLNDVEEKYGGATEFKGTKVQPNTGKMLIFPSTWTYIHSGQELHDGNKYIVTMFITT